MQPARSSDAAGGTVAKLPENASAAPYLPGTQLCPPSEAVSAPGPESRVVFPSPSSNPNAATTPGLLSACASSCRSVGLQPATTAMVTSEQLTSARAGCHAGCNEGRERPIHSPLAGPRSREAAASRLR